ncbi:MAG TPA: thioredoxin domain-containing protein [Kofleriaceae bacterium]
MPNAAMKDSKAPTTAEAPMPAAAAAAADHSGDTEARLRRLEDYQAKNAEALDFLAKVYAQQKQQQDDQERSEPAPDAVFAVNIADDIKLGKVEGPATAPVTIVKAFDFACPYCQRTAATMNELVDEYQGKVRVVFKDLIVHPQVATDAHMAACAAAKQNKYKVFKDAIWEKGFQAYASARDPSKLGKDNLLAIAKDTGLNVDQMTKDMASDECKKVVQDDMNELQKFKVNATPGFFINGIFIGGALDKAGFKKVIDERLKIAEASGVAGDKYYDQEIMGKGEKQFRSKMDPKPQ